MSVWRLVAREILFRRLNFGLGVLSVLVAVGCLVGELTVLRAHDLRTAEILAAKEAETRRRTKGSEDAYRKIMKKLGFNVLILPKEQNLGEFYADDFASKTMPEDYADRLANSKILTVRHLLPSLQRKIEWPERRRKLILIGTRGEVPLMHRAAKEPMLVAVPPGTMVVGYELHRSLGLEVGDEVELMGRAFKVSRCQPERGNKDDITIWIDLAEAQELLGEEGEINAILALKCHCAGVGLAAVRAEIARILPETQVIEVASRALARAEARDRAAADAREALEAERRNRARMRGEIESFASVLIPLVMIGCAVWVGLLAFGNVRERRPEIGILRAIGVRSRQILLAFLARTACVGLLGAVLGYAAGLAAGILWGEVPRHAGSWTALIQPAAVAAILVAAPVLSALAGWVPALLAAQQDPAVVLREE